MRTFVAKKLTCLTALSVLLCCTVPAQAGNRFINFAGGLWLVKDSPFPNPSSPGPNFWDSSEDSVWVDGQGRLHLKVRQIGGVWHSSQVTLLEPLDFGDYRFQVQGDPDLLDPNVVLGLFMFSSNTEEIDIELSRWGAPADPDAGQFVVQPYTSSPDNIDRFSIADAGAISTYRFDWQPDSVFFEAFEGGAVAPQSDADILHQYRYNGPDVPPLAPFAQISLNLWLMNGNAPMDSQEAEIIISDFAYTVPLDGDLNGDGFVGIDDLNLVLSTWNQSAPLANLRADASGDGFVGIDDLNAVLGNWNAGTPPADSANIPEPGAVMMVSLGGLAMIRRRAGG